LFFDSARKIAARIGAGICPATGVASNGAGCDIMCSVAHCQGVSAWKGSRPVAISYVMTPSE